MNLQKAPRSLRFEAAINSVGQTVENNSGKKVSAVAGLIAVASFSGAEAQQSSLPPVTVDAPVARPRPAASKPSPDQLRARSALRRAARPRSRRRSPRCRSPMRRPGRRSQPLRGCRGALQGGSRAGVRQVSGAAVEHAEDHHGAQQGGACGQEHHLAARDRALDRRRDTGIGRGRQRLRRPFFIRGFDARNDVFIDGIRDPAVSIRENFFTEQIEILRGPASSYAGRGTAGGAINIVTKQARDRNFYNAESTFGTDHTKRVTFDVNQVISPTFSIRTGGMFQDANVAGRNYVTDDRWGGFISTKWTPTNDIKITTNYVHTDLSGLPDFGVPYYKQGNGPVTEFGIPRQNWYGFVNRDFQTARQDFGTLTGEYKVTDSITLTSRTRAEHSMLAYIGTLPNTTGARQIPIRRNGRSPRARRAATSGSISWRTRKRPRSSSTRGRSSTRRWSGSKSPTSASGSTAIRGFHRKLLASSRPAPAPLRDSRSMRQTTRSFRSAFRRWSEIRPAIMSTARPSMSWTPRTGRTPSS